MKIKHPPTVEVHPISFTQLKKGHPWVTADDFSSKFPKDTLFVVGECKGKKIGLLMNDPRHPLVKARLWTTRPPFIEESQNFSNELLTRLERSISKRLSKDYYKERENLYLVFGESDLLPGLHIVKLGQSILLQFYSNFWNEVEAHFISIFKRVLTEMFPNEDLHLWVQQRNEAKKRGIKNLNKNAKSNFILEEFGVKYKLKLQDNYDNGIYTDMASIRKKLAPHIGNSKSVLNLYCYTGAFSLFALKEGASEVNSVDLSKKYLSWLEENLELNPELDKDKHLSIESSVEEALDGYIAQKKYFDTIICDPPSFSSDGNKKSQAFQIYPKLLRKMSKVSARGGVIIVFLNTHQIPRAKFKQKIERAVGEDKSLTILEDVRMGEDCPIMKSFPESDYLKGIIIQKK